MKIQSIIFLFFLTTLLSCSFGKKIKTGEQAFERKQYSVAIDLLIDEYEGTSSLKNQARKAYLLGECYKYLKDDKESLYWYEVADKQNYGVEALRELAYAYKSNGKYSQAVKAFEKLNNELGNRSEIRREIAICGEAIR